MELVDFAASKYAIPLLLFAHSQAVSFMVSKVKEAAGNGTSEMALFLVQNYWTPRVADKVTLPVVLVCPIYLFMSLSVMHAFVAWAATYAVAFMIVLYMQKISIMKGLNGHFFDSAGLAPVGYGLALYFLLTK